MSRPGVVTTHQDLPDNELPLPLDTTGLAHWLGIRNKTLWWLLLNRKTLYKMHTIPKPKGGVRILHEPDEKLKFAQRMALDRILAKFPTPDHFGAYVDKRGVSYTAQRHAGHAVILELDIKDFFPSTTRRMVREFFFDAGWPMKPTRAVADLLTCPLNPTLSVVPQGAPTSAMLCNLIGDARFDRKILAYLASVEPGWVYTRYSDNIIVSHPAPRAPAEVNQIRLQVRQIIRDAGYRVHAKKTKIMRSNHPKKPQRLLGLTVNQKPNVPVGDYRLLRAQVYRAKTKGFEAVTGLPPRTEAVSYLEGRLNYYLHVNPRSAKLQKLKHEFLEVKRARKCVGVVFRASTPPEEGRESTGTEMP